MFDIYCLHSDEKVEIIAITEYDWVDFYSTMFTSHRGIVGTILMEKKDNYSFNKIFNAIHQKIDEIRIHDELREWELEREEFHYDFLRDYLNSDYFQKNIEKKFWPENFWGN